MNAKQPSINDKNTRVMDARYRRAQALMQGFISCRLVCNDDISPYWIANYNCFWYLRHYLHSSGDEAYEKEYRLVDANTLDNKIAFDHDVLARALEKAVGEEVNPRNLPFDSITVTLTPLTISFTAFGQHWKYDSETRTCNVVDSDVTGFEIDGLISPDGKLLGFTRNYNLWVRDIINGKEWSLTDDGEIFNCYAALSSAVGVEFPGINLQWSPNSKRLLTVKRDSRDVKTTPMVNHVPKGNQLRPTVRHIKVSYPGDKDVERYKLLSIDIASRELVNVDYPRLVAGSDDSGFLTKERRAWWSKDCRHAYFIAYRGGGYKVLRVVEVDTDTGTTRILFEEAEKTFVNLRPEYVDLPLHRYLPDSNELVWWSQRTGFGHLYLYDLNTGDLKHAITKGHWVVRNILHVDAERRELWIQSAGRISDRNPYYRDICRVHIDTGELVTLVSTDDEWCVHSVFDPGVPEYVGIAPSADYLVATRSRVDKAPVSLLLNRDGRIMSTLETGDISNLPSGWRWPEPVNVKAADRITELYGVLFRPSGFCEDKKYPVINMIVGGPWLSAVPHGSFHNSRGYADRHYFQGAALAELGFIVVLIDSRGTPLRHKSFQETCYGWLPAGANSDDQRYSIEQLAKRYPEMDLNRVGVYSPTGYHGGIQNLFECPDFYQVGVINNLMDSRLASRTVEHSDKYQGVNGPAEDKCFPEQLVENWNGKLLLLQNMCGLITSAYTPAAAFRLVEAMQKANKDVDMVVTPYYDGLISGYAQRRAWDYLVKHLQGSVPPKEFSLGEFSV